MVILRLLPIGLLESYLEGQLLHIADEEPMFSGPSFSTARCPSDRNVPSTRSPML